MEKQLTGDRAFSARAGSNSNKSRDEGTVGSTEDKVHSMSDPLSWGLKLLSHREGEKRREEERRGEQQQNNYISSPGQRMLSYFPPVVRTTTPTVKHCRETQQPFQPPISAIVHIIVQPGPSYI